MSVIRHAQSIITRIFPHNANRRFLKTRARAPGVPPAAPLGIIPAALVTGQIGVPFSQVYTAIGTAPITCTHVAGTIPVGCTATPSGANLTIAGTPSGVAVFSFTLRASNAAGTIDRARSIQITV